MSDPSAIVLPRGGLYPERDEARSESAVNRRGQALWLFGARRLRARLDRRQRLLGLVSGHRTVCETLDLEALGESVRGFRRVIRRDGVDEGSAARAFALVRRAMQLAGSGKIDDTDFSAAWVMLSGGVAETPPTSAQSAAIALAACTAALAGQPVHVIGPDEDWACRTAEGLAPVCEALGIPCGVLRKDDAPAQRQAVCGCAVVVASARELAFEYLRDRLRIAEGEGSLRMRLQRLDRNSPLRGLTLRGLAFGIVAEADAVLLDGANAPIAISGQTDHAPVEAVAAALKLAGMLVEADDFSSDSAADAIALSEQGKQRLAELTAGMVGVWQGAAARERLVELALRALHLCIRGRHYRVEPDGLLILDPLSGAAQPGSVLPGGLQQMVEAKEGLRLSSQGGTLARLALQRFFRRYVHLCGISATAREAAMELAILYRLPVVRVPLDNPPPTLPMRVLPTAAEKWTAIAERVAALQGRLRPVLVGVGSPGDVDSLGGALDVRGIAWRRAERSSDLAVEGEGPVFIALPVAWRPAADLPAGRFHVVLAEGQPGGRLDRQLARRTDGEAGNCEAILSLEDPVVRKLAMGLPDLLRKTWLLRAGADSRTRRWLYRLAQRRAAQEQMRMRQKLLQYDTQLSTVLAFAGKGE